jgi:hypothetical protein
MESSSSYVKGLELPPARHIDSPELVVQAMWEHFAIQPPFAICSRYTQHLHQRPWSHAGFTTLTMFLLFLLISSLRLQRPTNNQ